MSQASCPICWDLKKTCERPAEGRCKKCKNSIVEGVNHSPKVITYAKVFYTAECYTTLYKTALLGSMPSLDTNNEDTSILRIQISEFDINSRKKNDPFTGSLDFCGPFTTENILLIRKNDDIARRFSPNIKTKDKFSELIETAALAGGHLHLLCSVVRATEKGQTFLDGIQGMNDYDSYNLEAHYKVLLVCRLQQLIDEVMGSIRDRVNCEYAFAAATILRNQLSYFISSLKFRGQKHHTHHFPGLNKILVDWFSTNTEELDKRLQEGCGRNRNWQYILLGPLTSLRRHNETLHFAMSLEQYKHTHPGVAIDAKDSPFKTLGDGHIMLSSTAAPSRPTSGSGNYPQVYPTYYNEHHDQSVL